MPVWSGWKMGLKLSPSVPWRAESSLKLISMGPTTESLRITGYLQLAQDKQSFEVNSGNPYATDFIFVTSLDQLLLSRVFPICEPFQALWFSFTRLCYFQWVLGYLLWDYIPADTSVPANENLLGCQSHVHLWRSHPPWQQLPVAIFSTSLICPIHHLNSTSRHSKQSQKATDQLLQGWGYSIKPMPQRNPGRKGKWQGPKLSSMCIRPVTFKGLL